MKDGGRGLTVARRGPPASGSAPTLETRGLTVRFGGHIVVNNVSCAFERGTLTAIVGPNGAGKTTFFNLISGQLKATSGSVHLHGNDITGLGVARRTACGIGRAFQLTNLFPDLTVRENVRLAVQARAGRMLDLLSRATSHGGWTEVAEAALARVGLADRADDLASQLSHGGQRRLEVAILMALDRPVLMFDEPTAGMSLDEMPIVLDLIRAIKADKRRTVLLVEHKMDVVRSLADRVVVLHNGYLVADGDPATVMESPIVQDAYLGMGATNHV